MHINPISAGCSGQSQKINNSPVFRAVLLKDNVALTDKNNAQTINAAIVELETEPRELIADARIKARQKMSDEEFDKIYTDTLFNFMDKYYALDSITDFDKDLYLGDYKFMEGLAQKNKFLYAKQINERVQKSELFDKELSTSNASYIGEYWHNYTNGKMDIVPSKNYGLLNEKYEEYIKSGYPWNLSPTDSLIPLHFINSPKRQRIILAVDSQKDGNYRDLKPDMNVYGIAEIYTERAMDAVEDYCTKNKKLSSPKTPEKLGEEAIDYFGLKGSKIEPVNAFLIETLHGIKGAGKALLNAICDRGKYYGVFVDTSETMSHGFFLKNGFNYISGWKENKLFKPGFIKSVFH